MEKLKIRLGSTASCLLRTVLLLPFFFSANAMHASEGVSELFAENNSLAENVWEVEHETVENQNQKEFPIKGNVFDGNTKEPVIGASVMVKSEIAKGAVTDVNGEFTLDCKSGDILTITYLGYETKEIKVSNLKMYSIELFEASTQLDDIVVTAFGVGQKKASMVGAVEQIKPGDLKVPSSSLSSAFAGRMAGVIAVQRSGEPGADGASFWIRGKSTFSGATGALIVIDGVEASTGELNRLAPEVIESFSILKDATATALYGTRGANGVMIVTTKSGQNLEKPIINVRLEGAISQLTKVPKMVGGVEYIDMYNEGASRPSSGITPYSEDKRQGTLAGLNPYMYPNVDWYDEMFKKNSFAARTNFNIRGGSNRVDYFMSVSVNSNGGNLRSLSKDFFSYDNNIKLENYDFVNNLNIKATSTTKISLGLNLSIRDWKGPEKSANDIFNLSKIANPVDFPIQYPQGSIDDYKGVLWGDKAGGPYNDGFRNPIAEYVTGNKSSKSNTISAKFSVEQKLDMLLEGLRFSGLFSYKNWSQTDISRTSAYNHFVVDKYDPNSDEFTLRRLGNENQTDLGYKNEYAGDRTIYIQGLLDYNHTFGELHDVNLMFLYNQQEYGLHTPGNLLSSLAERKQGIAGRASYVFDSRYLAEVNFGYNGSENFPKGKRFGFFPSAAVGYIVSEEKYWEPISPYVSKFKLRGSWGLVGNDRTGMGRFTYLEDVLLNDAAAYTMGMKQNSTLKGPTWKRYFNNKLTWEVGEKINLGVELQFFKALNLNVDIFKENRKNIFMARTSIPDILGMGKTTISSNIGKMSNTGLDLSLDYNKQINKDLFISFKGTFTYAHNKYVANDEPGF